MRLKKVYLHGYKTFANKTELRFDSKITAIVGPNGSGKSNVADAIRWVMGEQAYSVLRGKKSEDMIFNGSDGRPRLGMAEAVITLDNTDNWLPIDFDEVVIGRRAYRSGENEYYLNGSRVRLRDIHELLDRSGLGRRTHTVIGQGMIDQALAQRPEDRRELFEEAAGITLYRRKREQAVERLDKTHDNLVRVRDIIAEIAPRLRQLEKQAERARQHQEIGGELRSLLLTWYGHNWHQALRRLVDARVATEHWQSVIARSSSQVEEYNSKTVGLRERQVELRQQLAVWRQQLAEQEAGQAAVSREQAVGQERLRALHASGERLQQEIELLQRRRQGELMQLQEAEAAAAVVDDQHQENVTQLAQADAELQAREAARRQVEEELAKDQRARMDFNERLADRSNRIQQAQERRQTVTQERAGDVTAAEAAAAEADQLQQQFQDVSAELEVLAERIDSVRQRHRGAEARQKQLQAKRQELQGQRTELDAQARTSRARYELLDRLRAEGEGLYGGVRQVVQASQQGRLHGVLGPMANLLDVPDRYELAMEVALGARLQDIVVQTWTAAEAAIGYLKANRSGRATFLPLDNLYPLPRRPAPAGADVLGWAADLVGYEDHLTPAVELLLGQILVVTDLAAARRVSQGEQRYRIVTLEGDFVHPGGSVSGGSNEQRRAGGGMLAREREWRSLPTQIASAEAGIHRLRQEIEHHDQALRAVDDELTALVREATGLSDEERSRTGQLMRLQSAIDRARQTESWHRQRARKLAEELETLGRQLAGLRQESGEFSSVQGKLSNRIAALEEKLATLGTAGLLQAAAAAAARVDAAAETRRSQQALVESRRSAIRQTEAELALRQQQFSSQQAEIDNLNARLDALRQTAAQADHGYQGLLALVQPAQSELEVLEQGWAEHDHRGEVLRQRLHQEELQHNQAQLAQQRAEDRLTYLRSQIEHDFGLVAVASEAGFASQEPLPFDQLVTRLPHVETIPKDTETEIRRLKGILSRLGPVNPDAQAEYAATLERHEFLNQQAIDLEEGSAQLLKVIGELDQLMDQEFRRTFDAVSKAFTRYFTRLFGGGTARLTLTDPADMTHTGVEIIARPPGKRATSLALLSGGERALTATALIFAIISVSPTPFCVLDEVDAALDEANIRRVREVLAELTEDAQFILITHNRGTLEIANTIYGISMGADNVSQSLSLKLDNGRLAPVA